MQRIRARWLLSAALICGLGGCSFQLYDKEKDEQAKALKTGLAAVSFDEVFATAQANHNAVSEATNAAHHRLAELGAKNKLFTVLTSKGTLSEEDGFQFTLAARWAELMCEDADGCAEPSQVAEEWRQKFCENPSPFNEICQTWEINRLPVRFSRIVELGITDYDPNSLRIPGLRLADSADNVLIAAGRKAPKCAAMPIADDDLDKPVRMLPPPVPAIPGTEDFIRPLSQAAKSQTRPIYDDYIRICQETLDAQYGLTWLVGENALSGIGMSWTDWHTAADELTKLQIEMRKSQALYDADNAAYKQALKEIAESKPGAEDRAEELLGKAGKALDAVAAVNDFGIEFAAEERLKALREIIAILGGKGGASGTDKSVLTDDVRKNLAAVANLPHLVDESADLFAAAEEARLSPLVLELAYQEQVLKAVKLRIAAKEAEVERRRQFYFAAVAEAGKIGFAQERLADAQGIEGFAQRPLYELLEASPSAGQAALFDALTAYYESQVKFNQVQNKLLFDESAAAFQRNLDENQIALNQWLTLSKSDSDILAAYFAAGVKPEDVAALLVQLLGLGGIAVGVNR
jgi:hypothetical protein